MTYRLPKKILGNRISLTYLTTNLGKILRSFQNGDGDAGAGASLSEPPPPFFPPKDIDFLNFLTTFLVVTGQWAMRNFISVGPFLSSFSVSLFLNYTYIEPIYYPVRCW